MKSLLPRKYHNAIYVFALCLLAIGMSVSVFLMSLSQFILAGNWFLEGNLKEKVRTFFKNTPALIVCSLLLMHFVGVLYTNDFDYALKDIRIKSPLLILPLILSTSKPLTEKLFNIVVKFFVAAVLYSTLASTSILLGIYHRELDDIRGISIFISHIRFALLICVSFYISIYYFRNAKVWIHKIMWGLLILWWPLFLLLIQSLTGLGVMLISAVVLGATYLIKYNEGKYKVVIVSLIIGVIVFIGFEGVAMKNEIIPELNKVDKTNLPVKTKNGYLYFHDTASVLAENGNLVWINVCVEELDSVWNMRSKIKFSSTDERQNPLKFIAVRFLASKGLTKDADGINALTDEEISAIENGITNVKFMNINNLKKRIYETLWEIDLYNKTGDANGHSLTQRFEYWKTATAIINENLLIGVGTGDIAQAFEQHYEKSNSSLKKEWRLRSHNQYLSIAVAFGLIGLVWFLFSLFYPPVKMGMMSDFLYLSFFCIALLSFFTEDTLETQAGVTFYALLNSLFLFTRENIYSVKNRL